MLADFVLPKPDSRVVIFGDTIFKLKYKLSPNSPVNYKKEYQSDLVRLTKGILKILIKHGKLHPVRTNLIIAFPGLTSWEAGKTLQFSENGKPLAVYPNTVLLVVHLMEQPHSPVARVSKRVLVDDNNPFRAKRRRYDDHKNALSSDEAFEYPAAVVSKKSVGESSFLRYIISPIKKLFNWR